MTRVYGKPKETVEHQTPELPQKYEEILNLPLEDRQRMLADLMTRRLEAERKHWTGTSHGLDMARG
jgi:hypothetical protein